MAKVVKLTPLMAKELFGDILETPPVKSADIMPDAPLGGLTLTLQLTDGSTLRVPFQPEALSILDRMLDAYRLLRGSPAGVTRQ